MRMLGGGRPQSLEVHAVHLWCGPGGYRSPSAGALRQEWRLCRDWFMGEYPGLPGTRPWAWWDARGEEPPSIDEEPRRLAELGELADTEVASPRVSAC